MNLLEFRGLSDQLKEECGLFIMMEIIMGWEFKDLGGVKTDEWLFFGGKMQRKILEVKVK